MLAVIVTHFEINFLISCATARFRCGVNRVMLEVLL